MTDYSLELEDGSVEVIISAPFDTDIILDSSKMLEHREGYEHWSSLAMKEMQTRLAEDEEFKYDFRCNTVANEDERNKKQRNGIFDTLGDNRGQTPIPRYFLSCKIAEKQCDFYAEGNKVPDGISDKFKNFKLQILNTRVRFYEFGLGTIVISLKFKHGGKQLGMKELKEYVESNTEVDFFREQLEDRVSPIIKHYQATIKDLEIPEDPLSSDKSANEEWMPFWVHRLFCITTKLSEEDYMIPPLMLLRQYYKDGLEPFERNVLGCDVRFFAGLGNSVLLLEPSKDKMEDRAIKLFSRVLTAMGVYSAAMSYKLPRDLFFSATRNVGKDKNIGEITKSGKEVVRNMQFAYHVASLIDQYRFSLDPASQIIQEKINNSWDFDQWEKSLQEDVKHLERIQDSLLRNASGLRQEILNRVLLTFTFISIPFFIISYDLTWKWDLVASAPLLIIAFGIFRYSQHEKFEKFKSKFKKNKQKNAAKN